MVSHCLAGPVSVFRYINTCTYIGVTDTQILCRFSYFAFVCRPRHTCRVKIGDKSTCRRHVADMLPTFPAKTIGPKHAIADTGATSIFIMDGANVANKRVALRPLSINLADGSKITSTHVCDIHIHGLPHILTGHIVPALSVASLIGIRPLCKVGCKVLFDDQKCDVIYNGKVIL